MPNPSPPAGRNVFHDHLDVCRQCRENPLGLCSEGRDALRRAVDEPPASPLSPPDDGGTTVCETCHVRVASVTVLDRLRENFRQADESRSTNAALLDRALGENAVLAQRVKTLEEALRNIANTAIERDVRERAIHALAEPTP